MKILRLFFFLLPLLSLGFGGFSQTTPAPDSLRRLPPDSLRPPALEDTTRPARVQLIPADSAIAATAPDTVKPQPRPSPLAIAQYKDETTYMKVVYSQPFKKGRVVFGNLEKWGQIWRTGANEATEITFTRDVKLDGKVCRAGTYTLFSIPNPDKWVIVLNADLGQWGAYNYKAERDVLRFEVPAEKNTQIFEALTFRFTETDAGADLTLTWDDVKVTIPIQFSR